MPRRFRLEVNGVGLAVTDHAPGRGDRPALVLAHATGFCGGVWEPLVPALADRFRVITFDQRGHGESDKPDTAYAWTDFAADLAGVLDASGSATAFAAGPSMGGAAVAGAAARFPGRLGRIALIDPVLIPPASLGVERDSSNRLAAGARRRREDWESREEFLASLGSRPPFSYWREDLLAAYAEHGLAAGTDGRARLKCPGEIEARVYEAAARSSSLAFLPEIEIPTLIVSGEASDVLPATLALHARDMMRDAQLVMLPGVGHFVPMQAPERTVELLRGFLAPGPVA